MPETQDRGRILFFVIFTVSGFSGLIYEAIWSHYLKLFLGHAAYAQTLVLAIFMGGMAIGSWLMSRRSERIGNLLLGYAVVEGVIGLFGLVFHGTSIAVTSWAFDVLLPNVDSAAIAQISKWTLGAALILPQSILLGMTFPLMSAAIVRRHPQRSGETLAMLYFTNCLGAALGVLTSGFVLVGAVGLPGTIMTAGLLNIALALTVWGITKYRPDLNARAPAPAARSRESRSPEMLRWMLAGAAITGAAAFLYEIAWIRMLSLVLGSTTHSFELMLSAFILGIALGGLWVHQRIDGHPHPVTFLGRILVIMALVALASLPIYNLTFDMMSGIVRMFSPTEQGYTGFHVASHVIAMLVMIPTTFFCGMTLPIMTHVLIRSGIGERAIGAVYAWNTAGAIVGIVIAVHVLMPIVGVKGIVVAGALLHASLGIAFLSKASSRSASFRLAGAPLAVCALAVAAIALFVQLDPAKMSSGVFRHGHAKHALDTRVLFLEHGKTASVSLIDIGGLVSIATNGKPDASVRMIGNQSAPDEITMVLAGALPVALHAKPARVANIGIGSGLTSHVLLASEAVREVDTVEIEPLMAEAAELGFMPRVERTFRDPRSRVYFEDAKTFFALHGKKYDVIVSEPSNPWVSGVATLFSTEFYRQITRYLEPRGLFVQWMQIYESDMDILTSVMKALAPEFEDFAIYNADDANVLIVAIRSGQLRKLDPRLFESQAMHAELTRVGITSVNDIESRFLGNKRLILPLLRASGVPANSDYFPFVDLNAPRTRILKRTAIEFPGLTTLPLPFFDLLEGAVDSRDRTFVSANPTTARDLLLAEAALLRDALATSQYGGLDLEAARALLILNNSKDQCPNPAVRRAWLDSAGYVGAHTSSALSANELKSVWDAIARTPCAQALSTSGRQMLLLLRSIAARDVASVASTGAALFESNYRFATPNEHLLALVATAASQIAINQPEEALALLRANSARTTHTASFALALRWLFAIAVDRASGEVGRDGG